MTNEKLAQAVKQGAPGMEELWRRLKAYISAAAWRYYARHRARCQAAGVEGRDLVQEGYLALVDAVAAYDEGKGYALLAYLKYPMKKRFSAAAGGGRRAARCVSMEQPVAGGITLGETLEDAGAEQGLRDAEERIFADQLHQALEQCLATIPEGQARAVRARYWRGERPADRAQLRAGLNSLRRRKSSRALEEYRQFIIERHGYSGTLEGFRTTWTSSTERAVMELEKRGI